MDELTPEQISREYTAIIDNLDELRDQMRPLMARKKELEQMVRDDMEERGESSREVGAYVFESEEKDVIDFGEVKKWWKENTSEEDQAEYRVSKNVFRRKKKRARNDA